MESVKEHRLINNQIDKNKYHTPWYMEAKGEVRDFLLEYMKSKYPNQKYRISHYRQNKDNIEIEFEYINSNSDSECDSECDMCDMSVKLSHIKGVYSMDPYLLTTSIYANIEDSVVYVPNIPKND